MRYLIQQYYNKRAESDMILNRIEDSWNQLFSVGPFGPIYQVQTGVSVSGYNDSLTKPAIILYLVTCKELTTEQIQLIEKQSNSLLFTVDDWTDIDLLGYGEPNEKQKYFGYNFVVRDIVAPDILESWLKD